MYAYLVYCDGFGLEYISDAFEATMQRSVDEIHAHDDQGLNIFNELSESSYPHYLIYKISLGVVGDQDFIVILDLALKF